MADDIEYVTCTRLSMNSRKVEWLVMGERGVFVPWEIARGTARTMEAALAAAKVAVEQAKNAGSSVHSWQEARRG